ncbi:MAG: 4Fe-4S dicluster domain-containing protein [Candidatus Ozemobacteraceae bacterium]
MTAVRSGFVTGVSTRFPTHARHANGTLEADATRCNGCRACVKACPVDALVTAETDSGITLLFRPGRCAGCVRCVDACTTAALHFVPQNETYQLAGAPDQKKLLDIPHNALGSGGHEGSVSESCSGEKSA